MLISKLSDIDNFVFRDLHPCIHIGTASDRYAGWIGQIYTQGQYKLSARSHKVGNQSFKEETLPIESVAEYFKHFAILEIDFTFYQPLLNRDLEPTSNYHLLQSYSKYLKDNDPLILKVPQIIFARKLWKAGKYTDNPDYLNVEMFIDQFYNPANAILGENLAGFIFEQEYQRQADRIPTKQYIANLDQFIEALPDDDRYHIETRTDGYHIKPYFEMLEKHGVGHVLSHWTWLPPLRKQFNRAGKRFYSSGKQCIVRLLTPLNMRYQDAYSKAHPFNTLIEGMMTSDMISETIDIMRAGIREGVRINLILNNRSGGNAPLIAKDLANKFNNTL